MAIAASWRDILILVDNIKNNLKNIETSNNRLDEQLNKLSTTFRDEGIDIIRGHIAKTKKQIEDAVPSFNTALQNMVAYACLLKQAEENIHQR